MTSKANAYVGDLILDYDDGHHHEEYTAKVTRASILGDDWIVQFDGSDSALSVETLSDSLSTGSHE